MNNNSLRLLRPQEAMRKIGVGQTTFYSLIKNDPSFPRPARILDGGRAIGFVEAELDLWIQRRLAARLSFEDARL